MIIFPQRHEIIKLSLLPAVGYGKAGSQYIKHTVCWVLFTKMKINSRINSRILALNPLWGAIKILITENNLPFHDPYQLQIDISVSVFSVGPVEKSPICLSTSWVLASPMLASAEAHRYLTLRRGLLILLISHSSQSSSLDWPALNIPQSQMLPVIMNCE